MNQNLSEAAINWRKTNFKFCFFYIKQKNKTHPNEEVDHEENIESKVDLLRSVLKPRNTRLDIVTVSIFKFKV